MALRLPAALLRGLLRIMLRPFVGQPFRVFFQRVWLRLASTVNAPWRAAEVLRLDIEGMPSIRARPHESDTERTILLAGALRSRRPSPSAIRIFPHQWHSL